MPLCVLTMVITEMVNKEWWKQDLETSIVVYTNTTYTGYELPSHQSKRKGSKVKKTVLQL